MLKHVGDLLLKLYMILTQHHKLAVLQNELGNVSTVRYEEVRFDQQEPGEQPTMILDPFGQVVRYLMHRT